MQENEDRWLTCLPFMQEECSNQDIVNRAFLLQEKKPGGNFNIVTLSDIEKARSYCEDCQHYQKHTT